MLKIDCDSCGNELEEPGAILLGPPAAGIVHKYHLCVDCFVVLVVTIAAEGEATR